MLAPKPIFVLDIGPLTERHHTGMANVTKGLAREMLTDDTIEARFMLNRTEIPSDCVADLVTLDGGDILWWLAGRVATPIRFPIDHDRLFAIYPSLKFHRRLFPYEIMIVHDLTTILMPQFHRTDAVSYWNARLGGDMASSDLLVAVSESTRADIRSYFPDLDDIPCVVTPLAAATPPSRRLDEILRIGESKISVKPFVIVLGTLEPRKNITSILRYVKERPAILDQLDFVFVGRVGWGAPHVQLVEQLGLLHHLSSGALKFLGFVSDSVRDSLIEQAVCVIYPSRYEGFGLPVMEALALGTPVITGFSSSLPEAGGPHALYIDFDSADAVDHAVHHCRREFEERQVTGDRRRSVARQNWARSFSWARVYARIRDAALALVH